MANSPRAERREVTESFEVFVPPEEREVFISQMESFARHLKFTFNKHTRGSGASIYDTSDDSIMFLSNDGMLRVYVSRQTLSALCTLFPLTSPAKTYLQKFFDLKTNHAAHIQGERLKKKIEDEDKIIQFFINLPRVKSRKDNEDEGEIDVDEGSFSFATREKTKSMSTSFLQSCLAVVFIEEGKAFLDHIFSFTARHSAQQKEDGDKMLNDGLKNFANKKEISIYIVGASKIWKYGGRKNLINLYHFLDQHGLLGNVRGANTTDDTPSGSVFIDLENNQVYAGKY